MKTLMDLIDTHENSYESHTHENCPMNLIDTHENSYESHRYT